MRARTPICIGAGALAACSVEARPPAGPGAVPASDPAAVLYLIGDAGAPDPAGEPVLAALIGDLQEQPAEAERIVVFLGDNLYPRGMPPSGSPDRAEAERRLRLQLEVGTRTQTTTFFLPGNHDWDFSGADGWGAVRRQEEFVEGAGGGWVQFLPDGGCPGPALRDVGDRLRLVVLDTEWWLRGPGVGGVATKPVHPDSSCPADAPEEVLAALGDAVQSAGERAVVVAGHHPLATGSPHGGYFRLREHVFPLRDWKSWAWIPLPFVGSVYPLARRRGITEQDLSGGMNRAMRSALDSVLAVHRPLAYVSGHVHGLEVLDGGAGAGLLIVSGAGYYGHVSPLRWTDATRFIAPGRNGYVKLAWERDGRVRLAVITVDRAAGRAEAYSALVEPPR